MDIDKKTAIRRRLKNYLIEKEDCFIKKLIKDNILEELILEGWSIIGTPLVICRDGNGWRVKTRWFSYMLDYSELPFFKYWETIDIQALSEKAKSIGE